MFSDTEESCKICTVLHNHRYECSVGKLKGHQPQTTYTAPPSLKGEFAYTTTTMKLNLFLNFDRLMELSRFHHEDEIQWKMKCFSEKWEYQSMPSRLPSNDWIVHDAKVPMQGNFNDCGEFTCMFGCLACTTRTCSMQSFD